MQSTLSTFERPSNGVGENENEIKGRPWKHSEDLKLKELVAASGPKNWKHIAENIQGRSGDTCRVRWLNHLDPKVNKASFSDWEDQKILEAHNELGNKWALIAKQFQGRTGAAVQNRWHKLNRNFKKRSSSNTRKTRLTVSPLPNDEAMQCPACHRPFPAGSMAHSTSHVSISQPSSSEAEDRTEANVPTKYIDFLGVGDS